MTPTSKPESPALDPATVKSLKDELFEIAKHEISEHLSDPELGPVDIADNIAFVAEKSGLLARSLTSTQAGGGASVNDAYFDPRVKAAARDAIEYDKEWGNGNTSSDDLAQIIAIAIARATTPAPSPAGVPDYVYDPDEWEFTCSWADRDQVHGDGDAIEPGEVMQVNTLYEGPPKFVAHVAVTRDEAGDPDEMEYRWFDSEEEARAALAPPSEAKP